MMYRLFLTILRFVYAIGILPIVCHLFASIVIFIQLFWLQDKNVSEQVTHNDGGPLVMNAFEMITLSQGLDLSALFDRQQVIS